LRPRLLVLLSALLFSTAGAAIKACGLTAWQVIAARCALGVLVLLALLPETRARWRASTLAIGAVYALQMILFVSATKLTSAANAIFLQSTAPLYLLVLGPWVLHEPVRRRDVLVMAALGIGLATILVGEVPQTEIAANPGLGNAFAATTGLLWALTVTGIRWTARSTAGAGTALVAGNVIACLACLPLALPIRGATPADWDMVVFLGVVQVGLAYVCLCVGMRDVPALETSLLMLIEPVLNPVWTWLVHGERVGGASLAGGAIVLAATAARAVADARRAPVAPPHRAEVDR